MTADGSALDPRDWWTFVHLARGGRDHRVELERGLTPRAKAAWRAREQVEDAMEAGGQDALDVVLALLASRPSDSDEDVIAVGAGPLEDLVHAHRESLSEAIADLARGDPVFARCLEAVWTD